MLEKHHFPSQPMSPLSPPFQKSCWENFSSNTSPSPLGLVFYQPEIPGNVGTLIRLCACWNVPLHLIEPLGFLWKSTQLKRAHMDYGSLLERADHQDQKMKAVHRHLDWQDYLKHSSGHRNIALVPQEGENYTHYCFKKTDHLVVGSEGAGLPSEVIAQCEGVVYIPMMQGARSLNAAIAAAIVLSEALRQTQGFFPKENSILEKKS